MCNAAKTDKKEEKKRIAKDVKNGKKSKYAAIFALAAAQEEEDEQTEDEEYDSDCNIDVLFLSYRICCALSAISYSSFWYVIILK